MNQPILLDAEPSFKDGPDGLIIRKDQIITEDQLRQNAELRNATGREGELMPVAAIPTIIVEIWQRQGFDILAERISARDIVKRLKAEGLDDFLTTNKRV